MSDDTARLPNRPITLREIIADLPKPKTWRELAEESRREQERITLPYEFPVCAMLEDEHEK